MKPFAGQVTIPFPITKTENQAAINPIVNQLCLLYNLINGGGGIMTINSSRNLATRPPRHTHCRYWSTWKTIIFANIIHLRILFLYKHTCYLVFFFFFLFFTAITKLWGVDLAYMLKVKTWPIPGNFQKHVWLLSTYGTWHTLLKLSCWASYTCLGWESNTFIMLRARFIKRKDWLNRCGQFTNRAQLTNWQPPP